MIAAQRSSRAAASSVDRRSIFCSNFRGRFPATRSTRTSGESAASMAVTASAGTFFVSSLYWLNCVRTVRMSAETCGVTSGPGGRDRTTAWRQSCVSVYFTTAARSRPSTRRRSFPSGSFVIWRMRAMVPTACTSCSPGSSTAVFFCATRNSGCPSRDASSTLRTERRRPTKNGTTMRGNTTRSLSGTMYSSCFF